MALYSSFGACSPYGQCGTCDAVYPASGESGPTPGTAPEPVSFGPTPADATLAPEETLDACARGIPWWGWLVIGAVGASVLKG
jgi:hypothetical protein